MTGDATMRSPPEVGATLARSVERHALGWLAAANAVGVLLAAELVWPALGDALAPFTYGRWIPLHMNWQLYGWCALPLVGVLLAWCIDARHPRAVTHVRVALGAWSLALALGGVAWLGGVVSGKLFLDWHGWARALLPVAMIVLWTVCAAHAWWRRGEDGQRGADRLRGVFLLGLLFVPGLLYWSAGRDVYPSVNPDSGGATGASLLGSTLGIVMIFGLLPVMLRVEKRGEPTPQSNRSRDFGFGGTGWYWWALAGSYGVFGAIDRGNASHHAWGQILGLGLLIAWVPLAWIYFRAFAWEPAARRWLGAAFGWWVMLVCTGFLTFLPGLSERLKFTNGLVGHAHLAMAGLVTAVNFVVLRQLAAGNRRCAGVFRPEHVCARDLEARECGERGAFWAWQGACAVHVGALMVLGWSEAAYAGDLFRSEAWTQALYGVRLAAGAVMLAVSVRWLARALTGSSTRSHAWLRDGDFMKTNTVQLARWLALGAGAMDFMTGLGLVFAPQWVLPLMGVAAPAGDGLVFLRWTGAFVGAVGASYLLAVDRGGVDRLHGVLEFTIPFRLAAGAFSAAAIWLGWLPVEWASVPVTDFLLAGVQVWLLRRGGWSDE